MNRVLCLCWVFGLSGCGIQKIHKATSQQPTIVFDKSGFFPEDSSKIFYLKKDPLYWDTLPHRPLEPWEIDTFFSKRYTAYQIGTFRDSFLIRDFETGAVKDTLGSFNFGLRKPQFIILHHTAQDSVERTFFTFNHLDLEVSSHYLIGKNGIIYPLVSDYLRAWHAGVSSWGSVVDINSVSVGIELDNNGRDSFPEVQIVALMKLLVYLKEKYKIPTANFVGHLDIAPGRKVDPSPLFPWQKLADSGFGYWYDAPSPQIKVPADFNPIEGLRMIGYNIENVGIALSAFRQHFFQESDNRSEKISRREREVLYILSRKYLGLPVN